MWVVAGVLLGLLVLTSLAGFHTGPHVHAAAGLIGVVAAAWLVVMAVDGRSSSFLWALLTADLVATAGVGVMAWNGLSAGRSRIGGEVVGQLEGCDAVAVTDLAPEGVVRVRGEAWSAVCLNGTAPAGSRLQVVRAAGVRLEVWATEAESPPPASLPGLDQAWTKEQQP